MIYAHVQWNNSAARQLYRLQNSMKWDEYENHWEL